MPLHHAAGPPALFADLSRLFFALRRRDIRLDYLAVARELQGDGPPFSPLVGYTAFDPSNDAQKRLHDRLASAGWHIAALPPHQAQLVRGTVEGEDGKSRPLVPHEENIRFDAQIAFGLGRVAGECARVVVVSDSFALADPILQTVDRGTAVELAFFSDELDPRWMTLIERTEGLSFVELTSQHRGQSSHMADPARARAIPGLR